MKDIATSLFDPRLAPTIEYKNGSSILQLTIWVYSPLLKEEIPLERMLAYEWMETINGIEVFIENPNLRVSEASLREDINIAFTNILKFDVLHFIK